MPRSTMQQISDEDALDYLDTYFARTDEGAARYSGSQFDTFAGGGSANVNQLTADDAIAVSMLAVHIPAEAALALLGEESENVSALLSEIDPTLELHELDRSTYDELLGPAGPATQLWRLLRRHGGRRWGVGPTTASKVMARKRPHLIPVYDSVVARAVGIRHSGDQWDLWWAALREDDGALAARLSDIRERSGQTHLSLLRVLDIILWMHGRGPSRVQEAVGDDE